MVGARPNFPKLAPVHRAAVSAGATQIVVHTGQHYDDALSDGLFRDLGIPAPDINLDVGSASHAIQTARIMERIEPIFIRERPDWIVLYGDVNSTAAAAIVASKLLIPIAHVEAGLRSFDRSMPEEINRMVTDRLADLLLTPSRDASAQLILEGEPEFEIAFVGNVMIDSLLHALPAARATNFRASLGTDGTAPVVVTLHRPSNVDDDERLSVIASTLRQIAANRPVIFPAHPRTRQRIDARAADFSGVHILSPVGYLEMLDLLDCAFAVVTDSGGLQEETTALGIPCYTVRENTERPVTITEGTNVLTPDPAVIPAMISRQKPRMTPPRIPEGWDGHAAERIIEALARFRRVR